jgi:putative ATP-dependent endonuclease of the OLD family
MKLIKLRLSNFQCFGPAPTEILLDPLTFLIGANGTGKTAVLMALVRLFGFERSLRAIRRSDFHVRTGAPANPPAKQTLWIEAHFEFPELKDASGNYATVPGHFAHMQLLTADGIPCVRVRLTADLDLDGEINDEIVWVLETDAAGEPTKTTSVSKADRNSLQVHYLPARRDPADHVSYAASTLLGRALRAANWKDEKETITGLSGLISGALVGNAAIAAISSQIDQAWTTVHKGKYYTSPSVAFISGELEQLLRHLTIGFSPGQVESTVDFSMLSDGQKSLLYFSLVVAMHALGRKVLKKEITDFDVNRFKPAVFTLIALEEPENSLSPHYLGRIIKCLNKTVGSEDAQALVSTHSPSVLKRVAPEKIRYFRLDTERKTSVTSIILPNSADEAHKFVREAVEAFPELYFSRIVILGEGDSEEVVLPRVLKLEGLEADDSSISIVPLGGRHVNHFWRLLRGIDIPYVTLLDLDLARYQGGWGRIRYAVTQLLAFPPAGSTLTQANLDGIPVWNAPAQSFPGELGPQWINYLEGQGVFFSNPLDLDFSMLQAFPNAYGAADHVATEAPAESTVKSVLGKSHGNVAQYSAADLLLFDRYHALFKLGSKPVEHLLALAQLSNEQFKAGAPGFLTRLAAYAKTLVAGSPE